MKARTCFLSLVVISMFLVAFANVQAADPVAAWTFEEGSGELAADATGNGNDGTVVGAPEWVAGKYGKGLKIMTVSQYVQVPDSEELHFGTDDFTLAAWIYVESYPAANSPAVMSKRNMVAGNGQVTLLFGVKADTLTLRLDMRDDVAAMQTKLGTGQIVAGAWYHVAVAKDSANVKFYVNGVEDSVSELGFAGGFTSLEPLFIGVHHYGTTWNCCLTGVIDEVAVYKAALTADELAAAMNGVTAAVESADKAATTWGNVKAAY